MSQVKNTEKKEVRTINAEVCKRLRGLAWVEEKNERTRTYSHVTENDRVETIIVDAFGIKYESRDINTIMSTYGRLITKGTFLRIKNECADFVKGILKREL